MIYWNNSASSEFTQVFCVVRVAQSLVFCVLFCGSLFTYRVFILSLELSALRRFTDSDHPFGIFIFFLLSRNIRHWLVGYCFHIKVYEWVLFNVKQAICQLHHGENKLILMILAWCGQLYTNALRLIFWVLVHRNFKWNSLNYLFNKE